MEKRDISIRELREWYETKTVAETVEHFGLSGAPALYRLLKTAGIEQKEPRVRLVE